MTVSWEPLNARSVPKRTNAIPTDLLHGGGFTSVWIKFLFAFICLGGKSVVAHNAKQQHIGILCSMCVYINYGIISDFDNK